MEDNPRNTEIFDDQKVLVTLNLAWSEGELECLCFGETPGMFERFEYSDTKKLERNAMTDSILRALKNSELSAEWFESGKAQFGEGREWLINTESAIHWAIRKHGTIFPDWLVSQDNLSIWARERIERNAVGRYWLAEAFAEIEANTNQSQEIMIHLLDAARKGVLPVFGPKSNVRIKNCEDTKEFFSEAFWDDLNVWLKDEMPRIHWEFPDPNRNEGVNLDVGQSSSPVKTASDDIPGKMPNTTIGQLAIKAAWEIERATGKRSTANLVILKLQEWELSEPILTGKTPHGVKWETKKGKTNTFDIQTCAKALETWNKSRV